MLRIVRKAWIRTLIAFDVRDPIVRTEATFALPQNYHQLAHHQKVKATICNLFANYRQPIPELTRLYGMSPSDVISILLSAGLIKDKRQYPFQAIKGGRRETDH
jgi:hypothetical protein